MTSKQFPVFQCQINFSNQINFSCGGGVAEWFRALDLKSGVP